MFPCLSSLLDLESWSMEMLCLLLQCSCGKLRSATAVVGFSKESVERGLFLCSTCTRHAAVLASGSSAFHYRWLTDIFWSSQSIQRNRLCRIPYTQFIPKTKWTHQNEGIWRNPMLVCVLVDLSTPDVQIDVFSNSQCMQVYVFILAKDRIEHTR